MSHFRCTACSPLNDAIQFTAHKAISLNPSHTRSHSTSPLIMMFLTKASSLALGLLALACHASPVSKNSHAAQLPSTSTSTTFLPYQHAKQNVAQEVQEAGIHSTSKIEDLTSKLPPLLAKYGNNMPTTALFYKHLLSIGISPDMLTLFKYSRMLASNQIAQRKYTESGAKKPSKYRYSKGLLQVKKAKVSKQQELYRQAREMEYHDLIGKLTEAGHIESTDPKHFLNIEKQFLGNLTPQKYGQLLGEHMIRTREDHGWYQNFVKARDQLKIQRYRQRKKLGLVGKGRRSTPIQKSFVLQSEVNASTSTTPAFDFRRDGSINTATSAGQSHASGISSRKEYEVSGTNAYLSSTEKWRTGPRSTNRRPRQTYSDFDFERQLSKKHSTTVDKMLPKEEDKQSNLIFDDDPSTLWKDLNVTPESSVIRPTTAVKKYTGRGTPSKVASTRPLRQMVAGNEFQSTATLEERMKIGHKEYTGAGISNFKTAVLAPKKTIRTQPNQEYE
jgi:hypothetical protein